MSRDSGGLGGLFNNVFGGHGSKGGGIGQVIQDLLGGGSQSGPQSQGGPATQGGGYAQGQQAGSYGDPSYDDQIRAAQYGTEYGTGETGFQEGQPEAYGGEDDVMGPTSQWSGSENDLMGETSEWAPQQPGVMAPPPGSRGGQPGVMAPQPGSHGQQPGVMAQPPEYGGQPGAPGSRSGTQPSAAGGVASGSAQVPAGGNGLDPLLNRLRGAGLGDQVNSWLADGPNKTLSPQQVQQGLGPQQITQLAQHAGVSEDEVRNGLSQTLPEVVDKLTPHGQIPDPTQAQTQVSRMFGRR